VAASSGNRDVDVRMFSLQPPLTRGRLTMSVTSGNGDVRLTLPRDFDGDIEACSGHGKVKSDFDLKKVPNDRSRLRGSVGSGKGPLIQVHTGNGQLEIRKD